MSEAAHPQRDDAGRAGVVEPEQPVSAGVKNPFPSTMTVPDVSGEAITVELVVLEGVLYAPLIDELPITPPVRQYITQYCAAWSTSVLTVGKLDDSWPEPPRRAQIVFHESQLHTMLGLAADERLVRAVVGELAGTVQFVVESPRLPAMPTWNAVPLTIGLPVAAWYEVPGVSR